MCSMKFMQHVFALHVDTDEHETKYSTSAKCFNPALRLSTQSTLLTPDTVVDKVSETFNCVLYMQIFHKCITL